MTTLQTSSVAFCVLFTTAFTAQEQTPVKIKRMAIHDFYVQPGMVLQGNANANLADFQKMAPQSSILKTDLSGYSKSGGFGFDADAMLTVLMGIQFSDKQKTAYKKNPLLRVGISYLSGGIINGYFNQNMTKPYDTLTSSQTGQVVYRDSIINRSVSMNYRSQQIRLDASFIFRTNPEARWSLYAGIGVTAGVSLNASTNISYSSSNTISNDNNSSNGGFFGNYYSGPSNYRTENHENSTNIGASVYIPMGVDFRLGRKREFWKRTHLFYEARPGINMNSIPELGTMLNATVQQGIGLRVSWN